MSQRYQSRIAEQQRLTLLQALEQDNDYRVNDLILQTWLDETGMALSMDKLRTELSWLEEQGLITLEIVKTMKIATLTERGLDVVRAMTNVPGVARPRPE